VGNTPLLDLGPFFPGAPGVGLFAKAEFLNPTGSVKDRAAVAMLRAGIKAGKLTPDKTILDATSGNTGISYATFGAALGYRVELCIPANASRERRAILQALGAVLNESDPLLSSDGAELAAEELAARHPERYFFPDQYNNPENWLAHYHHTAREIWEATGGEVSHFVSGIGSGGTFVGVSRRLKELNPGVTCVLMQPDSPFHALEGNRHLETTRKPGFYDPGLPDRVVTVTTEDAKACQLRLARTAGLFVGTSSGANVHVASEIARSLPPGSLVVTILCDSGFRYLDDSVWRGESLASPGAGNA
jgi:cysteine synthase B